ncbi:MAG: DUF4019 domain-containing protein [bacterium]|nr:DUF4019 domain-containing protein [bacterium]
MKKFKSFSILILVSIFALSLFSCKKGGDKDAKDVPAKDTSKEEAAAVSAATDWLKLTDAGKYDESWDATAAAFQAKVEKEGWNKQLDPILKPLGKLIKREVKSKKYATSLPGAPDGEYVVIQFQSSFENKDSAIETVTPMKEADGSWKVSGYYIK